MYCDLAYAYCDLAHAYCDLVHAYCDLAHACCDLAHAYCDLVHDYSDLAHTYCDPRFIQESGYWSWAGYSGARTKKKYFKLSFQSCGFGICGFFPV